MVESSGSTSVQIASLLKPNSTNPTDLFYAHIVGMDTFARGLITADKILQDGTYSEMRKARYASYDNGKGKAFEEGKLSLEDLRNYAIENGEPKTISGQQELYELIIKVYLKLYPPKPQSSQSFLRL